MAEVKKSLFDFYELPANEIMDRRSWELPLIEKDASVDRVLEILTESDYVWVVESEESKKVVGIITEHDILHIFSPQKKMSFFGSPHKKSLHYESFENAEHLMSRNPVVCSPDETVEDVLNKMVFHRIRRIPVIENDKIIGEITLHHLIKEFHAFMRTPARL
jgi:predicted transcriptional regulator